MCTLTRKTNKVAKGSPFYTIQFYHVQIYCYSPGALV